jgi:hypothetical protein
MNKALGPSQHHSLEIISSNRPAISSGLDVSDEPALARNFLFLP